MGVSSGKKHNHVWLCFFMFLDMALSHLASSHSSEIALFLVSCIRRS